MLKSQIIDFVKKGLETQYHVLVDLTTPTIFEHGDYSTNIAMKLAKEWKKPPLQIAKDLKIKLEKHKPDFLSKIEFAKPGYLNFYFKEKVYLENLDQVLKQKEKFGQGDLFKDKKIMVEFAHPNPFKVMHIGHLRNIILGESFVRLFEAQGAKVIRTNYQGDVGMHVAKTLYGVLAMHKFSTNPAGRQIPNSKINELEQKTVDERTQFLGAAYVSGAKAFEESEVSKAKIVEINQKIYERSDLTINNLWQLGVRWSLDKFHQVYERVYSHFDREYMESETLELGRKYVQEALDKGILEKSKGAVVFKGGKYGLDTRVFLNSKGFLTYEGKELGLAQMEFTDFGKLDFCIHNVAVEQISFFKVTFKVEELLNPELYKNKQYHNAYEFVGLKSGKMSSRKGEVVAAETILDEAHIKIKAIIEKNKVNLSKEEIDKIAIAAVKYAYLRMSPFKYLAFDLKASVSFAGDSGPYLQYTYARCKSIIRKFQIPNSKFQINSKYVFEKEELKLMKKLSEFPKTVKFATEKYSPNHIATYLNELAQEFNSYYNKHKVLGNEFRLALTQAVAQVLQNGLYLLGIKTLERM